MFLPLFALVILFIVAYWYLSQPRNLPPGPIDIPILGYLPWILYYSTDRLALFDKLKTYGKIVYIRVGFQNMVFLIDLDTIKEAFSNKGDHFSESEITHGKGILTSEGKYQKDNRRFILRSLKNMGFGKISFEEPILDSLQTMCEAIDKHISKRIRQCLTEAIADNISRIVFGVKFDKNELNFIIERLELLQALPQIFIIRIPFQDLIMKYVQDHKLSFDHNNISDFIYSYLEEQANHQSSKEESYWWDDDQIKQACTDLLVAGISTTDTSITWFLFLMANNQAWMDKVTNEIDNVIGKERKPSTRDLVNLPFCEASILETLRFSSLVATGIPHSTTENTSLLGYFIPKNTTVFAYLYNMANAKLNFPYPKNFNPSVNFLNKVQKEVINRDKFLPFGIGRRSCIGESLARMELTLFFITIFQRYTVSLDPNLGIASMNNGLLRSPSHRTLIFKSRL